MTMFAVARQSRLTSARLIGLGEDRCKLLPTNSELRASQHNSQNKQKCYRKNVTGLYLKTVL